MDNLQGMTRRSMKSLVGMVLRRWHALVVFSVLFALIASAFAWDSYAPKYSMALTFIPARYEIDQNGYAVETYSFNDSITRAYTYSLLVVDEQIRDAVRKAVDFDISKQQYENAVSAYVNENSAVVTVTVSWKDERETTQLAQAIKAYLTHVIASSTNVGIIKWVDGYSTELHEETSSQESRAKMFFIVGLLAGLCFGIALALILGVTDKRVYELENVEYGENMTVIGVVNKLRRTPSYDERLARRTGLKKHPLRQMGVRLLSGLRLLTKASPKTMIQRHKQLMSIAEYLLDQKQNHDKKTILFTSPTLNRELSVLISDIASIFAGNQVKILHVKVKKTLKPINFAPDKPNIIYRTSNVDEYIYLWSDSDKSTSFPKPVGEALSKVIPNYDLVFIECPPLLQNIELASLSKSVDATLLVFEYSQTTYDEIKATTDVLQRVGAQSILCVWNRTNNNYTNKSFLPIQS